MKGRNPIGVLFWTMLFCFAVCAITIISFISFFPPDLRGKTFFIVIGMICISEIVFFIYTAYSLIISGKEGGGDPAVRNLIHIFIGVWWLLLLLTGIIAILPSYADTFFSDKIILIQVIITFFLFACAYFLSSKSRQVESIKVEKQQESLEMEKYIKEFSLMISKFQTLGEKYPEHLIRLDRLTKKIESLQRGKVMTSNQTTLMDIYARKLANIMKSLEEAESSKIAETLNNFENILTEISDAIKT